MERRPSLFSPEIYRVQLERLRRKASTRPHARELESRGVSLSMLSVGGGEMCKCLSQDVASGAFRWGPLRRAEVNREGKRRIIHRPQLIDALVLGAMAQCLTALLEDVLTDQVYAYRPGRNPQLAIARLRRRLADHRREHADPRNRGLFVLQRDLSAYGESIPTHAASRLWPLLDELLSRVSDAAERRVFRELLTGACRPYVVAAGHEEFQMVQGLPTGSPIQQPLANLYLVPLDEAVQECQPELYLRFGDDLLVLDSRPKVVERIGEVLSSSARQLELRLNPKKSRNLYFTGPGRPWTGTSSISFEPASHLEYLGVRLTFDGTLGLKRKRLRSLLSRTRWRIENARNTAAGDPLPSVAAALRVAFHENTPLADPLREALCTWVDDRRQLRQLDQLLTQMCAELLSGVRGVKALRQVRTRDLRALGLPSVLELRRRKSSGR